MSSALQQFDAIPQTSMISCLLANGDEYVRCSRCHFGGCDVRVEGCGCTLHVVSLSRRTVCLHGSKTFHVVLDLYVDASKHIFDFAWDVWTAG
jgi:hypothetical protein